MSMTAAFPIQSARESASLCDESICDLSGGMDENRTVAPLLKLIARSARDRCRFDSVRRVADERFNLSTVPAQQLFLRFEAGMSDSLFHGVEAFRPTVSVFSEWIASAEGRPGRTRRRW